MGTKKEQIGWNELLESQHSLPFDVSLTFSNLGDVGFTTITHANLALLRRAKERGYPGVIVSCPDFERESLAISFLAALGHLMETVDGCGLHAAKTGEKVAIGDCVVEITKVNERSVMFRSRDQELGYSRDIYEFPLVHTATPTAALTRTKGNLLKNADKEYRHLPEGIRSLLDMVGKLVPTVGYASSPSQYLNEAPTHVLKGTITIDGFTTELSRAIPLTYLSPDGRRREGFRWPFEASDSVVVCPREEGISNAYPLLELVRAGEAVDFISLNIPSPDVLDTTLLSDILDLVDEGVGVIGFCDRWTLDRMKPLKEQGFLLFDWDDCELAERTQNCVLSPVQHVMRGRQREKVYPILDGESGLSRAKEILYDRLGNVEMYTDESWQAKQELFRSLGVAIRMTEAPDEELCCTQRDSIAESLEVIENSRSLSPEGFQELCEACEILADIFVPGKVLPKEKAIYDLITSRLEVGFPVLLVVDSDRTGKAYEYWRGELEYNDYPTEGFRVINTRDFMAAKGLSGDEGVIFCGWYDRGTMDRAVHSGIAPDMTFALYYNGRGGLELEWWRRANEQWHIAADRCSAETDSTLTKLGIEKTHRPMKRVIHGKQAKVSLDEREKDSSPSAVITEIERKRLQRDVARKGERSVFAVPVMFNDGTHVWLRAGEGKAKGGRLVVITDCLDGQDDKPSRKPASALLPGDVVLRTHSDKDYIRRTSEQQVGGYQESLAIAQRWKEPIRRARTSGLTEPEIVDRIKSHLNVPRSVQTVRGWVRGERIAPKSEDDVRSIFAAFQVFTTDDDVRLILRAASQIRGQHQRTGIREAEKMVNLFLVDVSRYGLDEAVSGFDDRHENGNIELLRITAIGEKMRVAVDRAYVM